MKIFIEVYPSAQTTATQSPSPQRMHASFLSSIPFLGCRSSRGCQIGCSFCHCRILPVGMSLSRTGSSRACLADHLGFPMERGHEYRFAQSCLFSRCRVRWQLFCIFVGNLLVRRFVLQFLRKWPCSEKSYPYNKLYRRHREAARSEQRTNYRQFMLDSGATAQKPGNVIPYSDQHIFSKHEIIFPAALLKS